MRSHDKRTTFFLTVMFPNPWIYPPLIKLSFFFETRIFNPRQRETLTTILCRALCQKILILSIDNIFFCGR